MPENADDLIRPTAENGRQALPVQEPRQGRSARPERFPTTGTAPGPISDADLWFLADELAQVANFLSGDVDYLHDVSVATLPQVDGKRNSKLIPSGLFFQWWQPQMCFGRSRT